MTTPQPLFEGIVALSFIIHPPAEGEYPTLATGVYSLDEAGSAALWGLLTALKQEGRIVYEREEHRRRTAP
jgi:hypothetical protein